MSAVDLQTTDVRDVLATLWHWWTGELRHLAGRIWARGPALPAQLVVVRLEERAAVVGRAGPAGGVTFGHVPLDEDGPQSSREAFRQLFAEHGLERPPVALRLPPHRGLRRTLELPQAAERELRQVVGHLIARVTPFKPDQVHFDCRVRRRHPGLRRLEVELTAIPRNVVEQGVAAARVWDLELHSLDLDGEDAPPAGTVSVLPAPASAPPRRRPGRWLVGALLGLITVLLMLAIALPLAAKHREARLLSAQLDAMRQRAEVAVRLRDEVKRSRDEAAFLNIRKRETPAAIVVLNELTRILPDGTWAEQLNLAGQEVEVSGFSPQATALIGTIESSRLFHDVRFRAPVARDEKHGLERFHISARLSWPPPA